MMSMMSMISMMSMMSMLEDDRDIAWRSEDFNPP